jgi:uncharacterized protein YndB with AHSA1/START domain
MAAIRSVSDSRIINAPPSAIFNLLADPRQHPLLDGSGSVKDVRHAPERLFLGAKFSMSMKMGAPYLTNNVVTNFVENTSIAWHHFSKCVWRYELEEVPGGTKVTESFTYDNPSGYLVMALGFPKRNRVAIAKSLERLDKAVTS